jgi:hypothetical protein
MFFWNENGAGDCFIGAKCARRGNLAAAKFAGDLPRQDICGAEAGNPIEVPHLLTYA